MRQSPLALGALGLNLITLGQVYGDLATVAEKTTRSKTTDRCRACLALVTVVASCACAPTA